MKKVCMITQDAPYIDRRILLQAKTLVEHGYDVTILYPFGEVNDDFIDCGIRYKTLNVVLNINNSFSFIKRAIRKILPQKFYVFLKKQYFEIADVDFIDYENELKKTSIEEDYDVYVAHDLPALPVAHFAAKVKSAKLVYDAHEFFTGQIALHGKRKVFFERLEEDLIHDVDLMFTVNEDIATLFYKKYRLKTDIKILLNSIEERQIEPINLHQRLKLKDDIKIVLYQGGFLEDRNLEILVKSAKYFHEGIVLVMLGYSFLEKKLKNIAKQDNTLDDKVIFMDRVPQQELLNYTAGADIGVIPYPAIDLNTKYCTPNKMFEFIASGIPMIANDELITVQNILNRYHIGYFVPFKDVEEIGEYINKILKDIDIMENKENILKAQKKLSWKNQEHILLEAYSKL